LLLSSQGIDVSAAKLAALHAAFDGLDNSDVITAFVSDAAARKVRDGAEQGNVKALAKVEEERKKWPPYMVMSSWDFADHRGNTAVHFAAKNGHEECLEFLLVRCCSLFCAHSAHSSADSLCTVSLTHLLTLLLTDSPFAHVWLRLAAPGRAS